MSSRSIPDSLDEPRVRSRRQKQGEFPGTRSCKEGPRKLSSFQSSAELFTASYMSALDLNTLGAPSSSWSGQIGCRSVTVGTPEKIVVNTRPGEQARTGSLECVL